MRSLDDGEFEASVEGEKIHAARMKAINRPHLANGQDEKPLEPFRKTRANDITDAMPLPDQVIEGVACAGDVIGLIGPSQAGKTTFATGMVGAITNLGHFLGQRVEMGSALYFASENPMNVKLRVRAFKQVHAIEDMPLLIVEDVIDLYGGETTLTDIARMKAEVEAWARETGKPVRLIVVDTLSRSSGRARENENDEMKIVIENLTMLAVATQAAVIFLHHTGKDTAKGSRGAYCIFANPEGEITVSNANGLRKFEVTKQRSIGRQEPVELYARFDSVQVGTDNMGPVFAGVLMQAETESVPTAKVVRPPAPRSTNQKLAAAALKPLFVASKIYGMGGAPVGRPCVHWDDAMLAAGAALKADAKHRASRSREALNGLRGIGYLVLGEDDLLWLA